MRGVFVSVAQNRGVVDGGDGEKKLPFSEVERRSAMFRIGLEILQEYGEDRGRGKKDKARNENLHEGLELEIDIEGDAKSDAQHSRS